MSIAMSIDTTDTVDTQRWESAATEAQIAVHWKEDELFRPSPKFIGQANLTDPSITERFSEQNFPECYREYADMLHWDEYWHTTLDTSDPPFWKWFVGGKLNVSYNCVDRHLAKYGNNAALIFVGEPESQAPVSITYQELFVRVNEMAALLRDFCGLKAGDRVTLHMPMIPSCRLPCWRARGWALSTPWFSVDSAAKPVAQELPTPAAGCSSRLTATTVTGNWSTICPPQ